MNLKDPEKEFFDDFEHKVTDKIKKYGAQVRMRCQVGGGHCEADWEKLVPEFMHFLWME